jgi:hypothetical protein
MPTGTDTYTQSKKKVLTNLPRTRKGEAYKRREEKRDERRGERGKGRDR